MRGCLAWVAAATVLASVGGTPRRVLNVASKVHPHNFIQTEQSVRINVDMTFCPHMCSGRGMCVKNEDPLAPPRDTAICICDKGWSGEDCSVIMLEPHAQADGDDCPGNCSSHGVCYRGSSVTRSRCYCDQGYTGMDCSRLRSELMICPNNCSGFGICTAGYSARMGALVAECQCDSSHGGVDCSKTVGGNHCPNNCFGHGECLADGCHCDGGWMGNDCSMVAIATCPNNCSSRGRCARDGTCVCMQGFEGEDCSKPIKQVCPGTPVCSGNGRCVRATDWFAGGCKCNKGFASADCSEDIRHKLEASSIGKNCPLSTDGVMCAGHGFCRQDDVCECHQDWAGVACQFNIKDGFEPPLSAHPVFMPGQQMQENENKTGFELTDAPHPGCLNNCSSHGVCHLLVKESAPVFDENGTKRTDIGEDLGAPTKTYACECDPGYVGSDCSGAPPVTMQQIPFTKSQIAAAGEAPANNEAEMGLYTVDTVTWDTLPSMAELSLRAAGCPLNCSSRGRCIVGPEGYKVCSCYQGWLGTDCSRKAPPPSCPLDCIAGRCVRDTGYFPMRCKCDPGYTGEVCDKALPPKITTEAEPGMCPNQCSYRGPCVSQQCVCLDLSWGGPDCSIPAGGVCKDNCNGNGICYFGICGCLGGYTGETCADEPANAPCPNDCNMRGKCVGGTCMCLNGFTGDDCSDIKLKCPKECSGHGVCNEAEIESGKPARCMCDHGWTGPDCANFPKGVVVEAPKLDGNSENSVNAQTVNAADSGDIKIANSVTEANTQGEVQR